MHPPLDSPKADLARHKERPSAVRWQILALLMAFSFMSWFNRVSMAVAYDTKIGPDQTSFCFLHRPA